MVSEDLLKSLIGLTEVDAEKTVAAAKFDIQVLRRDSEEFMGDMMLNENRVKIEIEKGLVVKAIAG